MIRQKIEKLIEKSIKELQKEKVLAKFILNSTQGVEYFWKIEKID